MGETVVSDRVQSMFGSIAKRYDLANSVLSLGLHHSWRRNLIELLPSSSNLLVLDLCTGTADLLPMLSKRFGKAIGVDFCWPMLEAGQKKIEGKSFGIEGLLQGDALHLPFGDQVFDVVSVAFGVRNFADLEKGLCEIQRVLRPGGHALILEFGQPPSRLWRWTFGAYSKWIMPLVGGVLSGNRSAYVYLPETSKSFPCGHEFVEILRSCGLSPLRVVPLSGGVAYCYLAKR